MGAKDSKPVFLTYEDAIRRVTDNELKRLKDAFKRSSTLGGYMTSTVFIKEVLGDGVPEKLADQMYTAFGGTSKGLSFKDLVCGLVLITRGKEEEKLKFIFGLYANESLQFVQKDELDALVLATEGHVPPELSDLFRDTDRVPYEHFKLWVLYHPEVTSVTKWLLKEPCCVTLSNDLETPTFYQTLAGVTHLEESDIIELEKRYWILKAQSKSGRFDLDTFRPIVSPPIPAELVEGLFQAFDENLDNHIDFKEMACGISACCRGPMAERQKFCFKLFDRDHDNLLDQAELITMIDAMLSARKDNLLPQEILLDGVGEISSDTLAEKILTLHDADNDGRITQEEYLVWALSHPLPAHFLQLLFQVCHVALGLKPQTKEDEGQIIIGWIEREERLGLQNAQTWYLVAITWWKQWLDYVNYKPSSPGLPDPINNNVRLDPGGKPNGRLPPASKSASIVSRKYSDGSTIDAPVPGHYSTLQHTKSAPHFQSATNSPTKYATLPRVSSSVQNSPMKVNRTPSDGQSHSYNASPSTSQQSTPNHSPRPHKRGSNGVILPAQKPGQIDNSPLIAPNPYKVMTLTNEGGRLKREKPLVRGKDYELLPEAVWKALSAWYGGTPALPRTVLIPKNGKTPELELHPVGVRLLRHQNNQQRPQQAVTTFTGVMGGIGGMVATTTGLAGGNQPQTPRRYLAYTACFSRRHSMKQIYDFLSTRLRINKEDIRLWKVKDEQNMTLLEDEDLTIEDAVIEDNAQILIEVRNKDLTWPEEMVQLAKTTRGANSTGITDRNHPAERGVTGLNNLGNTCFMNTAVQCVSNTRPLTLYFTGGMHLYELNRTNVLGMKGHVAQRYGELVKDLWSGMVRSIAPLKLRWTIGKYAPRFNGFQQHDCQELLAFLLDGLHEDLNRVHVKPYVELKDSDGRPDTIVAKEAWENHLLRNRSIIVDLFCGQLKSCVRCKDCGHTSVRFDPFTYLSLPLPMESCIHLEITVIRIDGSTPVKYGLRLSMDEKYRGLKKQLSELTGIPTPQLLLVEVFGALVKSFPQDISKIKTLLGGTLYAYELPPLPPIPTMSAEEERALAALPRVQCGLNQIQRIRASSSSTSSSCPSTPSHQHSTTQCNGNINNSMSASQTSQSTSSTPQKKLPNGDLVNGINNNGMSPLHGSRQMSDTARDAAGDGSQGSSSSQLSPGGGALTTEDIFTGFIVAVHRKTIRMDVYFLSSRKTRPSLFGTPLILPCEEETTCQDLYQSVWTQVSRLVSPLPPSETSTHNHAQDCDDSLGYEYPFTLRVVQKDGFTCAHCPWYRFCRGCLLECNTDKFKFQSCFIAIDWEPTALHLRYQTSQEKSYYEHISVDESRRLQTEPIDLDACLKAFTKEEELGEDEMYYCSKCKTHRLAVKKLDIWKLPPVLIIHLKRFQFLNGRWVKSQKIVNFPFKDFDPTNYIVQRNIPQVTENKVLVNGSTNHDTETSETTHYPSVNSPRPNAKCSQNETGPKHNQAKSQGTHSHPKENGNAVPIPGSSKIETEDEAKEVHEDDILSETDDLEDYTNVRYNLYAMACHSGILGGGHYVAYGRNPNGKWYNYNDSMCKEINTQQIDKNAAYILFYERDVMDYSKYMPDIRGKEPDTNEIVDEFESELKKMCVIQ